MEPYLNLMGVPETYGGFGPDLHWRGLHLVLNESEPKTDTVQACSEIDTCRQAESCC